jgi:uncharacterized membrane protein SpoIIM required for sporulation
VNEKEFVTARKERWERLLYLVDRSEISLRNLTGQELREMGKLYKLTAGDLAYVRTHSRNTYLLRFLNDLVVRTYGIIYEHPRRSFLHAIKIFLLNVPRSVRRRVLFLYVAILISLLSAVFSALVVESDSELAEEFVPADFKEALEAWQRGKFESEQTATKAMKTAYYLENNTLATLYIVGGGISFGILTCYGLYTNGTILGVFITRVIQSGNLWHFGAGVLPHGTTELLGIFIGSAAGLLLGWSLVFPGRLSRSQSLRKAGSDAIPMLILGIVMIWLAAPIEGYISHEPELPDSFKYVIGLSLLSLWLWYLAFCGRWDDETDFGAKHHMFRGNGTLKNYRLP